MRRRQRKQPGKFPSIWRRGNCFDSFFLCDVHEMNNYPKLILFSLVYGKCRGLCGLRLIWPWGLLWRSLRCVCGSNSKRRFMIGLVLVKQECEHHILQAGPLNMFKLKKRLLSHCGAQQFAQGSVFFNAPITCACADMSWQHFWTAMLSDWQFKIVNFIIRSI